MALPPTLIQRVTQYMCQHLFQKSHLCDTSFFFYSNHLYATILPLKIEHKSWGNYIQKKYWCSLWAEDIQTLRRIQRVIYLDFSTWSCSLSREWPFVAKSSQQFFILFSHLLWKEPLLDSISLFGHSPYRESISIKKTFTWSKPIYRLGVLNVL